MRNPERIDKMLELIKARWLQSPDMRLFQLLHVLQASYSEANNNVGKVESSDKDGNKQVTYDFFCVEDDQILEFLKRRKSENWRKK